jgi:hypothetical protein
MAPPLFVNTRLANKTGKGKSFWQYLANQFFNEFVQDLLIDRGIVWVNPSSQRLDELVNQARDNHSGSIWLANYLRVEIGPYL